MMKATTRNYSLLTIFITFLKIGSFTFGGGFAMIPIIQREVTDNHKWITEEEFLDMIAVTQSAPGPVAVNSAVFVGFRLARIAGALAALLGTILPSFIVILIFAIFLTNAGQHLLMQKFFAGVRPAIVALILVAGFKMGQKSFRSYLDYLVGFVALSLLLIMAMHPILLILLGALWGVGRVYYARLKEGAHQ